MIYRFYRQWRKVFLLSATFLFAIFILVSCKKKESTIGGSAYDPSELLSAGAIDTFTINSYCIVDDSIITKNALLSVLGEMNDPIFGKVKSSFYTQIRLASANPLFGDLSQISIDSFVLALRFADYTGNHVTQTFEVYQLNEEISSDTAVKYYEFSSLAVNPTNLVMSGKGTFKPDPIGDAAVDTSLVAPQMRLSLDTNLARSLMIESTNGSSTFTSNENFTSFFKGIQITTNNPPQSAGQGAVYSLDMRSASSKLTIYYKKLELVSGVLTPVRKSYDFVINENCQSFNHVEVNRTGTKVQLSLDNPSNGLQEFYAQSFGLRGVIEIPGLSNFSKKAVIHKAVLDLPIQYQTGSIYSPGYQTFLFKKFSLTSNLSLVLYNSTINEFTKSITTDMRAYVQDIVSGKLDNDPIYISPSRSTTAMDRIVFNGRNTLNKVKPKMYIIYTEF
jgi:hypothetical protein